MLWGGGEDSEAGLSGVGGQTLHGCPWDMGCTDGGEVEEATVEGGGGGGGGGGSGGSNKGGQTLQ